MVDAYGLVATVVINPGNKITIYIPIEYTGKGATKAVQNKFNKGITSAWTGKFGKYQVTTKVVAPTKDSAHKWNVIDVPVGDGRANCQIGGYYGTWPSERPARSAAHEAGHAMGLPDRYKDGPDGYSIAKDPNDKYWNKNIMGNKNQPPSQADIDSIINYKWNTIIR